MQNKGFTLVEILGVIVVIALLSLLITPNIINSLSKYKDEVSNIQGRSLEDVADEYLRSADSTFGKISNKTYCVSLKTLQDNGFVTDDLINASNGKKYDINKTYIIGRSGNNPKSIKYKINENSTCEAASTTCSIVKSSNGSTTYIGSNGEIGITKEKFIKDCSFNNGITITTSPSGWAKVKEVKIVYNGVDLNSTNFNFSGENIHTDIINNMKIVTGTIRKNQIISANAKSPLKEDVIQSYDEQYIDNNNPICNLTVTGGNYDSTTGWFKSGGSDLTISFKSDKTSGAPITLVRLMKDGKTINKKNTNATFSKIINYDTDGEVYTADVVDAAGNKNKCKLTYNDTIINELKRDTNNPQIDVKYETDGKTYISSTWINKKLKRTINYSDPKKDNISSGVDTVEVSTDNGNTWKKETDFSKTESDQDKTYMFRVKDKAGNITTSPSYNIKIDTISPTCTLTVSGDYNSSTGWFIKGNNKTLIDYKMNNTSGSPVKTMTLYKDDNKDKSNTDGSNITKEINYDTKGETYRGTVKDEAGNSGTCKLKYGNTTIDKLKRDTHSPTIDVEYYNDTTNNNVTSSVRNASWLNNGLYRYITVSDNYTSKNDLTVQYKTGSNWHTENNLNKYWMGQRNVDEKFKVTDEAGNSTESPTYYTRIDWTPPVIHIAYGKGINGTTVASDTCVNVTSSNGYLSCRTEYTTSYYIYFDHEVTCSDNVSGCNDNATLSYWSHPGFGPQESPQYTCNWIPYNQCGYNVGYVGTKHGITMEEGERYYDYAGNVTEVRITNYIQ